MKSFVLILAAVEVAAIALCCVANNPPRTLLDMPESEYNEAIP